MPIRLPSATHFFLLGALAAHGPLLAADDIVIDDTSGVGDDAEIVIDSGDDTTGDIVIDDAADTIIVDDPDMAGDQSDAADAMSDDNSTFTIGIDKAHAEYGAFTQSDAPSDHAAYGRLDASANWKPNPRWEVQATLRGDAYDEDGRDSFTRLQADYGDTFVRYRGDNVKVTLGAQTVIWGRLDELPLSDRVSTADLTRVALDDLENRRRANPMLRVETFTAGGKLDLVWLPDFRPAEMPLTDSAWYPIDQHEGRLLGIDPDDIPPALVRAAVIDEDTPSGDGGFGARYTRNHSFADIGVTVARTRQSIPYYRIDGNTLRTEYPRSWTLGVDAATNRAGATWRAELVYNSDQPVTRKNLSYTTVASMQWGVGVEMHPGDGDSRVNLQLMGSNLIDAPAILDRSEVYSLNGEIDVPFDRERWRASLDFNAGLDAKDIYINPEIAFLGWEPHELYLAAHYFDGSAKTLGGFYEDRSLVTLGWRSTF